MLLLLVVAVPACAAYHYRDYLRGRWEATTAGSAINPNTVVYAWTDEKGTVHYDESASASKKGKAIVIDTSRITRLEPLKEPPKADKPAGSQMLRDMRREMQEDQQKMRDNMIEQAMGPGA